MTTQMMPAAVGLAATMVVLSVQSPAQIGWHRHGYDNGNSRRYPLPSAPSRGSLHLLLADSSKSRANVLTSDVDGDGVADIVVCTPESATTPGALTAMHGDGREIWSVCWPAGASHSGKGLWYIGDVDMDSMPEIMLTYRTTSFQLKMDVYDHTGGLNRTITRPGTVSQSTWMTVQGNIGPTIVLAYDSGSNPAERGLELLDFSNQTFSGFVSTGAYAWGAHALGDADNDGNMDIAVPSGGAVQCALLECNAANAPTSFNQVFSIALATYTGATSGSLSTFMPDLNGDGVPELFFLEGHDAQYRPGIQNLIRVDPATGASLGMWNGFSDRDTILPAVLDDLDGDGVREIAVSGLGADGIFIVSGRNLTTLTAYSTGRVLASADFNGDGRTDLVVHELASGLVKVLDIPPQPGNITEMGSYPIGAFQDWWGMNPRVAVSDVTGNGCVDVVICTEQGGLFVLSNEKGWSTRFGVGCGRTGGSPTLQASLGSVPSVNRRLDLTVSGLPTGPGPGPGFLVVSLARLDPPASLAGIGMPGCTLYLDTLAGASLIPCTWLPIGLAWVSIGPLPPTLFNLRVFGQAIVFDPQANPMGVGASSALALRYGL